MASRKHKPTKRSTVGDDILHGLRELVDTIKSGQRMEERLRVRVVEIPEPARRTGRP